MKLYNEKSLKPEIEKSFSASEIVDAHNLLESGKSKGKIVLYWD